MQGRQWYGIKRIKLYFRELGIVEKGLGHVFITSSSSHFFNKTDFEQYLFGWNRMQGLRVSFFK